MRAQRLRHAGLAGLVASTLACAHAPAATSERPEVVWPEPPAPARVRLVAVVPDPSAPLPSRPWWKALTDLVAGVDRNRERAKLLVRPFGVAVVDGDLVVADPDRPAVVRIDAQGRSREIGCGDGGWVAPMAVVAAPDGALYVADGGAAAIVRWTPAGCTTIGGGELERPTGVAVSADRLYVVDPPGHRVVVMTLGGEVVARWGGRGEGPGRLNFPTGVALAHDGTVLVVDALNFRIARFTADGHWAGSFGTRGESGAELARPKAVASDRAGRVYVTDAQRDLVLVFAADGTFEYALGASGAAPGRLSLPAGVAVSAERIYVCDSHNARVQVFEIVGGRS
jgi:sugar lactone lactonase YvrE